MRPGNQSNKRMRGRGRKGPNPLTRTYESNGPDVKIRGTAMHVAEKYQQLARDAQASGDRVMFESYNQHAEHYLRIVAAAQPQQQPSARHDADDAQDQVPANGSGSQQNAESPKPASADVVDGDAPQPFIDNMPVIDQEGQVNGAGKSGEADAAEGEDKPRRRTRTPRARTPRAAASESADGSGTDSTAAETGSTDEAGEDQPKPRRKTTRPRRTKPAEETAAVSE